jgi:V/A-type H+-transporting ATPase subunit A
MEKQLKMMRTILYLYSKSKQLIDMSMPMSLLKEEDIFEKVISIKYDVANDELDKFNDYKTMIDSFYNRIMAKNA